MFRAGDAQTIRFGYVLWDDCVATTNVSPTLIHDRPGYDLRYLVDQLGVFGDVEQVTVVVNNDFVASGPVEVRTGPQVRSPRGPSSLGGFA